MRCCVIGTMLAVCFAVSGGSFAVAQTQLQPTADGQAENEPSEASLPAALPGQVPTGSVGGMGDVNLYPRRVVIAGRDRSATVGLYNRASVGGEYDITISDMIMLSDGRVVDLASISDPEAAAKVNAASTLLRWSPRKVQLPANEAQLVRIMVRVPPDLPAGEYRSHFTAVSVPSASEGLTIEQATGAQDSGVGVQIVPRFGISIPVIVRVGETTAVAGLAGLTLVRGPQNTIKITITREGTRSVFGDVSVTTAAGKVLVAQIKGIGVYTELDRRSIEVPVRPDVDPTLYAPGARLTVTYTDDDFAPGQILAKADFSVQ